MVCRNLVEKILCFPPSTAHCTGTHSELGDNFCSYGGLLSTNGLYELRQMILQLRQHLPEFIDWDLDEEHDIESRRCGARYAQATSNP